MNYKDVQNVSKYCNYLLNKLKARNYLDERYAALFFKYSFWWIELNTKVLKGEIK